MALLLFLLCLACFALPRRRSCLRSLSASHDDSRVPHDGIGTVLVIMLYDEPQFVAGGDAHIRNLVAGGSIVTWMYFRPSFFRPDLSRVKHNADEARCPVFCAGIFPDRAGRAQRSGCRHNESA